jgi:hypothetical protein
MYEVATMHTTHKRTRVIQMAKTRVHKNNVQKGKGDREGIYQKKFPPLLTVHLSITLSNDQLDAQIFNTFTTILYMCMFQAISCSSSGGQIVLIQHLVSVEITNKMQLCNRIYYSTAHRRLYMFRPAYRSSSGALTVFLASGLRTHVVTGRSQV